MQMILLVDDDKVQALTRKAVLAQAGYVVSVVTGAGDALRLLRSVEPAHLYHLMITDHLMPEMNGPELVVEARRLRPNLPILVLSGLSTADTEYEDLDVEFRAKPFPPEELTKLIGAMIGSQMRRTA